MHNADLANSMWFSKLPETFQNALKESSVYRDVAKGQMIFHNGDEFDGLYAVLEGAVGLGSTGFDGREAISAIIEPIFWFGEISLIDQQPRSHHAIACKKTKLLHVPAQAVYKILDDHPEYWMYMGQLMSQKLRFALLELFSIQNQNIQQRVAQRLLFILQGYGNLDVIEKRTINLTQEQLAQMLMCSRQTINYELQQLEKLNLIKIAFKQIEIIDTEGLIQITGIAH